MQLISLWVEDFKNLKNFTINFENQENLSIIIGNNGSGKSNILELLSGIFAELYENKEFIESSYTLIYSINDKILEITKEYEDGEKYFTIYKVNGITKNKSFLRTQNLLPNNIIALYSGEDDRLYKTYYEYFANSYLRSLSKVLAPKNSMIYIDKKYWGIALLAFIIKAQEDDRDAQVFLNKELNIDEILDIYLEFDPSKIKKLKHNSPLELFIRNINPGKSPLINMSIEFFYPFIGDCRAEELFSILAQGITIGAIKDVSLVFNDDNIPSEHMSEGEKKKLLVKAVFDILGTENSLILMDEPDAHLHVAAKDYFYNLAKQSAVDRRCIVITTHSPTLTNCADDKHIIMLTRNSGGNCEIIDDTKKSLIQQLTGNIYSINEQNIIFNSSKPLVLVEGKSDIKYIKRALELYKEFPANYDFISFNGTGNAYDFYSELQSYLQNRKVIILLDRDEAGTKALGKFIKQETKGEKWKDYISEENVYYKNDLYVTLLPKTAKYKEKAKVQFLIEDYFSEDCRLKILNEKIEEEGNTLKSFGSLEKKVKSCLENRLRTKNEECMDGFKILLSKIKEIIDGDDIQNLVEISDSNQ